MIDYSTNIYHVSQTGMQCWTRSSQMILSYILIKLGLSHDDVGKIWYKNILFDDSVDFNSYKNVNQLLLGRKLRPQEQPALTLDDMIIYVYNEFGGTAFLAEVFPAFIKNFVQYLSKTNKGKLQLADFEVILYFDNDNEIETYKKDQSPIFIYKTLASLNKGVKTGYLNGEDNKKWSKLTLEGKQRLLISLLEISPILIETPSHALVLSGYVNNKFIVNDSLTNHKKELSSKQLVNSLSAIILLAEIKKKKVENS